MNFLKIFSRFSFVIVFFLNSILFYQQARANETGRVRLHMEVMMSALEGSKTYKEWIQRMPFEKKSKDKLERNFSQYAQLNDEITPYEYSKVDNKLTWPASGDEPAGSFILVSLKPLTFKLNEKEVKIDDPHPTMELILKRLMSAANQNSKSALWKMLLPETEAGLKKIFKKIPLWIKIPWLIMSGVGLVYAGMTVYDLFKKGDAYVKKYDAEEKSVAPIKAELESARANPNYPYLMTDINCMDITGPEGERKRVNPLAEKGEDGYTTFGMSKITLTPRGSEFAERDINVNYSQKNGKSEIKDVWLRRKPNSEKSKNLNENDCRIFAAYEKEPKKQFNNDCIEKAFPGRKITNLNEFYSALGTFNLKQYEAMAATNSGCNQLIDWNGNNKIGLNKNPSTSSPSQESNSSQSKVK